MDHQHKMRKSSPEGRILASVTVEAALVMPWVLMIIFGIITFSLWQADSVAAEALACESAQLSLRKGRDSAAAFLDAAAKEMTYSRLEVKELEASGNRAYTGLRAEPFGIWEWLRFSTEPEETALRLDPASFLRWTSLVW